MFIKVLADKQLSPPSLVYQQNANTVFVISKNITLNKPPIIGNALLVFYSCVTNDFNGALNPPTISDNLNNGYINLIHNTLSWNPLYNLGISVGFVANSANTFTITINPATTTGAAGSYVIMEYNGLKSTQNTGTTSTITTNNSIALTSYLNLDSLNETVLAVCTYANLCGGGNNLISTTSYPGNDYNFLNHYNDNNALDGCAISIYEKKFISNVNTSITFSSQNALGNNPPPQSYMICMATLKA